LSSKLEICGSKEYIDTDIILLSHPTPFHISNADLDLGWCQGYMALKYHMEEAIEKQLQKKGR